ncbi:MAG: hypothetical protein ABWY27_03975 [Telluria sp.]
MKRSACAALLLALALGAVTMQALAQEARPTAPAAAAALPADVASVDAIVAALYDVISGPAGKPRDWNRLRSLFAPTGKMMAVGQRADGSTPAAVMTVDDYIGRVTRPFAEAGFYETELARSSESFGPIAHVFSTYESRHAPGEAKPFQRGINSIQLVHDGSRWWIASLLWRAEGDKSPLPERYLKSR